MSRSEQGCYRASADPTIGHCLQQKLPAPAWGVTQSWSLLPWLLCITIWESSWRQSCPESLRAKPCGSQHSVRAGESPGLEATHPMQQEQHFVVARRISGESLPGAVYWCAKMLMGVSCYTADLSCTKSESRIWCMLRTPPVRRWKGSALQVPWGPVGRAAAPTITGEGRREDGPSAAPPACSQYKSGAQIFTAEKLPSSSRRTWLKSFITLLLNLPVVHS